MADGIQTQNNERTPLLGAGAGGRNDESHDFVHLNRQVKSWKRRRWISLIASLFLIAGFVVILILSGILSRAKGKPGMASSLCLTSACVHAASDILYNLAPNYESIDACTNFDQLVCDGFNDRHDIPADRSSYSTITSMFETGQTIIRHILEGEYPGGSKHSSFSPRNLVSIASSTDEDNFNKMKEAYSACANETALKEIGVQPLVSLIQEVADSFPVKKGNDSLFTERDSVKLSDTILLLEKWGVSPFVYLSTGADDKNPEVVIIQLSPGGLGLPSPEYYQDDETVQKYQAMLEAVFSKLLPSEVDRKRANATANSVVELEKKIAAITPAPEDQQDVTKYYNIVKVKDAGKIAPALGYDSVIQSLVPSNYTADTMLLAFPEFLANVSQILTETSKSTIQAYLIFSVIQAHYAHVEGPEVEPISRFSNVLAGKDPEAKSERWKTCISFADNQVGWILGRFFVEAAFSEEAKKFGDEIVMDIKQQFITKLHALSWMDESVKQLAVNKVNLIDQKIGYPTKSPDIMNPTALRDYYQNLDITNSFFNNTLSSNFISINRTWSALGKPVDHGEWGMNADTVNAYYNPVGAEIVFPAGIMQFPVFQVDLPSYVSYGAFASVAGHELSHAFDNSGRHYDEHGQYTDWWTNHTVEEFTKRADCFVEQYSNFTIEGNNGQRLHVNGRLTLGENIADAGGVAAAFEAWKQRQQSSEVKDQSLPGLDHFSHEQLFFIFYANFWCGKIRAQQAIQYVYTDPHSPAFARILGTTANSGAFREAFSCPVKEPTCELW
ncbi:endothelin-converting enzyme [Seiridium cupressi]